MSRALFHAPAGAYFLSHSVGLSPRSARETLDRAFLEPWAHAGEQTWPLWLAAVEAWRAALAPLLGAHVHDLCPQTNISSAITKIIHALPQRKGRTKIILTEDDFPTVGFVAEAASRAGYRTTLLEGGARLADPDAWAGAFRDDVQLVIATHVFSNSSRIAPVAEIAARAREAGAFSLLDIAQSAGAVRVDLNRWGADFAVGTSVKYLCGGPGAAFLWAREDAAAACRPVDVGWFSHEAPFEMDIRRFRFARGAARFWGGTPSVAPFAIAAAGLEALAGVGVDAIAAHRERLLDRLFAAAPARALASETRPLLRGASALIRPRDLAAASNALRAAGIHHDTRDGALRVSVHLYTSEDDIDALIDTLAPLI